MAAILVVGPGIGIRILKLSITQGYGKFILFSRSAVIAMIPKMISAFYLEQ